MQKYKMATRFTVIENIGFLIRKAKRKIKYCDEQLKHDLHPKAIVHFRTAKSSAVYIVRILETIKEKLNNEKSFATKENF